MKATLKKLAELTSSQLIGDENFEISGVNTLEDATSLQASFLANPRYLELMKKSKAGVICLDNTIQIESDKNYLISENPSLAFQKIVQFFLSSENQFSGFNRVNQNAAIHPTAKIKETVTVLPNATIDKNVIILDNTFIGANVYIGPNCQIGKDCIIHSNVTIREGSIINNRVILQPGAVIGSCGFGYLPEKDGSYKKLDQMGNVIIEDDVEIGANTCIDRARFKHTIIKKGTKIDNLVQIAHNVEIGEHTAIAAQSGIAGSAKIGSHVIMGGQVGVTGHIEIENKTMLATRSGVSKNLKTGKYRGSPAIPIEEYNRQYVAFKNLEKTLKRLEEKINKLESNVKNHSDL
ncbi:MAG: UDP-3-O-(3-hydroxymyristoyl)glucosamine N-acyltransferase [Parachlamydiales bacterium]|jgi:UDP-3-O-[3-hydroxymyristoyl] glucosamine N-acyltransferase